MHQYVDPSVTTKVYAALNGMKLGGQVITAVQAFPDILSLVVYLFILVLYLVLLTFSVWCMKTFSTFYFSF